jgi:hypothetical protein
MYESMHMFMEGGRNLKLYLEDYTSPSEFILAMSARDVGIKYLIWQI